MKKSFWNTAIAVLLALLAVWFGVSRSGKTTQRPAITNSVPEGSVSTGTNSVRSGSGVIKTKWTDLTDAQKTNFNNLFEAKLRPQIEGWCRIYAEHIAFRADDVKPDKLFGEIGRGNYHVYTFMVDGTTFAVEDSNSSVRVMYLNAPESKQLMQLPKGTKPDPNIPVTREEVAELVKADSGMDFAPADIRVIPTAFSSAMNGGANVNVGGDPNNAASWKFTMVFNSDGRLSYYMRGR